MKSQSLDFTTTYSIGMLNGTGSFLNAYTYTYWGFTALLNTGNLTKFGFALGKDGFQTALETIAPFIIPVFGTMLGAFIAGFISFYSKKTVTNTYQRNILLAEIICYLLLGSVFFNTSVYLLLLVASTLGGMQLYGFRKWKSQAFSTTVATGNMRTTGELWAIACHSPSKESFKTAAMYTFLVSTTAIGAALGIIVTTFLGRYTVLICAVTTLSVILVALARSKKVVLA